VQDTGLFRVGGKAEKRASAAYSFHMSPARKDKANIRCFCFCRRDALLLVGYRILPERVLEGTYSKQTRYTAHSARIFSQISATRNVKSHGYISPHAAGIIYTNYIVHAFVSKRARSERIANGEIPDGPSIWNRYASTKRRAGEISRRAARFINYTLAGGGDGVSWESQRNNLDGVIARRTNAISHSWLINPGGPTPPTIKDTKYVASADILGPGK